VVSCLKECAVERGWDGIEFRIGPSVYLHDEDDQLSFCLAAGGFQLCRRWLTHVIRLPTSTANVESLLPRRKKEYMRAAERKGVLVREAGLDQLEEFYTVLAANRASRFGVRPTHTLEEIRTIAQLVPQGLRLFLCRIGSDVAGGTLVFELNARVAYNFYPCHADAYSDMRPALMVGVRVLEHYVERGFRYLDLGPSTYDDYQIYEGVASFKEDLGARGYCRDTWQWRRS